LLLTIVINRERNCSNDSYKRSCGNFKGGGGKNPLLSMTLGQFAQRKKERKKEKKKKEKRKRKNIYI